MPLNKIALVLLLHILLFSSCADLKYTPIKTPAELAVDRINMIEKQLYKDFAAQQMKYQSIAFGETELVKPPSHYVLDSLYEIKYGLEKKSQKDGDLEENIRAQQLIVSLDTTETYYIENHVFGLESMIDSIKNYDVFLAEIYVGQDNKIQSTSIIQSATVPKKFANLYACYALKTSFIFPNTLADAAEMEFYNLYDSKLETLSESEKNGFLLFMLSVMRVASRNNTLDKQFLIKEFVRMYVQGSGTNMMNENFIKMEEFFDADNQLMYYLVDYKYIKKNDANELVENYCDVLLDPYLQLVEIRKK